MNLFFLTLLTIFSSSIFATLQNSSAQWWLALELASDMTNDLQTLTSLSLVNKNMDRLSKERRRRHQFNHFNHQIAQHCNISRIKFMSKTFSKFAGTFFATADSNSINIGEITPECFKAIAKGIRFLPYITKLIVKEPYTEEQTMSKVELFQEIQEDVHILFNQTNNIDTIVFHTDFTEWVPDFTRLNMTNVKNWEFRVPLSNRSSFISRANIETLTLGQTQMSSELINLLDKMQGIKMLNAENIGDDIFKFKSPIIEELTIYADIFNDTLLKNFPNMHKITVKGTDRQFWTNLNSIERQFSSLKIMFISNDVPSYLIGSALAKQKQFKSLSIELTDESYDGIRSLMRNSHIEHLSLVIRKDFDFSFLHNAQLLTSLRLAISPTEHNFLQIENILKSSSHLKKVEIVQDYVYNLDIAKFLNFYERLMEALAPNSELGLNFHLTENTEPPFFPDTDAALKELMKQMGIISEKYLAKELIINGIEIKDFVNGLMDYESLPITLFNTRIEIGG